MKTLRKHESIVFGKNTVLVIVKYKTFDLFYLKKKTIGNIITVTCSKKVFGSILYFN